LHFIETLPKGFDTMVNDSFNISTGEKQLLTIARLLVKNTPFIILDEATANVDTQTEQRIQHAMNELTSHKTTFIIAHRLSTIKSADLIVVINNGKIIEQGNHDELLKLNKEYSKLYYSQFKSCE
jgi:ATP-binding cassette subfamily B protein